MIYSRTQGEMKENVDFLFLLCPIGYLYYKLEFSFGNFKSLKDIQTLNLTAARIIFPNPMIEGVAARLNLSKCQDNPFKTRTWI